ncbi:MAG: hypothetical protein JKY34_08630 [Kordiimonadaceae bacterium]|nr:hypothetical protein [Kordiimonadaceae bacterium]
MSDLNHDLGDLLKEMAARPLKRKVSYQDRVIEVLHLYAAKGKTLEWCTHPAIFNRSIGTLKKYCRIGGISFSDYVPMTLRKKNHG